jgi:hypothetical protein
VRLGAAIELSSLLADCRLERDHEVLGFVGFRRRSSVAGIRAGKRQNDEYAAERDPGFRAAHVV